MATPWVLVAAAWPAALPWASASALGPWQALGRAWGPAQARPLLRVSGWASGQGWGPLGLAAFLGQSTSDQPGASEALALVKLVVRSPAWV
mmetsp:Transcript_18103/g.39652  ORF Transcript_18103/g.39652 Transcript_18103/m.39652 type:complete len:91 (-) Transcript_18103:607-879(-)